MFLGAGDLQDDAEEVEAATQEFAFEVAKSLNEEAAKIASGEFSISQADEADTKEARLPDGEEGGNFLGQTLHFRHPARSLGWAG
eukprot:Skav212556  [mRNA]  locus=scaffold1851:769807:774048:- [translate_table: standard]